MIPASEPSTNSFKRLAALAISVLVLCGILYLAGCSTKTSGSLKHSQDVAQAFETYHVFPDHRYYYLNQENNPFGLVALQQHYTLSGVEWQHFDPEPQKFKKLVDTSR